MEDGTKKTIIWESNTELPKNYYWVYDNIVHEWDGTEWIESALGGY